MTSTRNAYGSLQRLTEDTEKDVRLVIELVAAALPVAQMDNVMPFFLELISQLRANANELRADLDLLTDEMSQL